MNEMRKLMEAVKPLFEDVSELGTIKNVLVKTREEILDRMLGNMKDDLLHPAYDDNEGPPDVPSEELINKIKNQIQSDVDKIENSRYLNKIIKATGIDELSLQTENYWDVFEQIGYLNAMIEAGEQSPVSATLSQKYGGLDTLVREELSMEIKAIADKMNVDIRLGSTQDPSTWDKEDSDRFHKELDDYEKEEPFMSRLQKKSFGDIFKD
jgi:hypothetical protein